MTAKGQTALASAEALLAGRLASLIGDLPRPEIDALARALPQVEAALSGAAPPRRPPPPRPPHPPRSTAAPSAIDSAAAAQFMPSPNAAPGARDLTRGRCAASGSQLSVVACSHARREIADHPRAGRSAGPAGEVADRARGCRERSGHAGRKRSAGTNVVRTRAKPGREIALPNRRSRTDGIRLHTWLGPRSRPGPSASRIHAFATPPEIGKICKDA